MADIPTTPAGHAVPTALAAVPTALAVLADQELQATELVGAPAKSAKSTPAPAGPIAQATDLVIIMSTFPKPEDLGDIAATLLNESLCACVNIVREVISIYRWNGEIVTNKEVLCLFKTSRARHAALLERLTELHPYEMPELVTLNPDAVSETYMKWVAGETNAGVPEPRAAVEQNG